MSAECGNDEEIVPANHEDTKDTKRSTNSQTSGSHGPGMQPETPPRRNLAISW